MVIIVDNPDKGIVESNLIGHNCSTEKPTGRCKHLIGNKPFELECAIHSKKWYKRTPCFQYNSEVKCNIGNWVKSGKSPEFYEYLTSILNE